MTRPPAPWPLQHIVLAAMAATGLSTRAFARRINVNERSVRRWLSGERTEIRDATLRAKIERMASRGALTR